MGRETENFSMGKHSLASWLILISLSFLQSIFSVSNRSDHRRPLTLDHALLPHEETKQCGHTSTQGMPQYIDTVAFSPQALEMGIDFSEQPVSRGTDTT